jgi:hypothetical protein
MSDNDILAALKNAHLHTENILAVKTVTADPIALHPVEGTPGQAEAEKAAHERGVKELEEHMKLLAETGQSTADLESIAPGVNKNNSDSL